MARLVDTLAKMDTNELNMELERQGMKVYGTKQSKRDRLLERATGSQKTKGRKPTGTSEPDSNVSIEMIKKAFEDQERIKLVIGGVTSKAAQNSAIEQSWKAYSEVKYPMWLQDNVVKKKKLKFITCETEKDGSSSFVYQKTDLAMPTNIPRTNLPTAASTISTSPKAVSKSPKATSPKATSPKATPKATTANATTPKATTAKATTPKATTATTAKATTASGTKKTIAKKKTSKAKNGLTWAQVIKFISKRAVEKLQKKQMYEMLHDSFGEKRSFIGNMSKDELAKCFAYNLTHEEESDDDSDDDDSDDDSDDSSDDDSSDDDSSDDE